VCAMSMSERGRLGGLATVAKYGPEHMRAIGRKGFKSLCCRFPMNSRRRALYYLHSRGLVTARYVAVRDNAREEAAYAELCAMLGIEDNPPF
jgi:hypothetical protein